MALNPKPSITHDCSFHFIFHYPNVNPIYTLLYPLQTLRITVAPRLQFSDIWNLGWCKLSSLNLNKRGSGQHGSQVYVQHFGIFCLWGQRNFASEDTRML